MHTRSRHALHRIAVLTALVLYPAWWMYPLFSHRPPQRLGTRFSDTVQMEVNSDGFRRGWSTFLRYGSDLFPDGQSFVRLDWISQFIPHVYTWTSSLVLLPADVLHSWILIGWVTSGIVIYWSLRKFGANVPSSLLAGILVQMMPAFRWFALNHVNYMFIALAIVPATLVLHALSRTDHRLSVSALTYAGAAHILLLFLDGYIGYFAVLLTILVTCISSTFPRRSRRRRIGSLVISAAFLIVLLLSGRIFAILSRGNATRTLRTYIGGVDSNVRTLVNPKPDIGFGNLSPFVGWPVVVLLIVGLIGMRAFRLPRIVGVLVGISTGFSLSISGLSWSFPLDVLATFVPRMRFYDRYAVLISSLIIAVAIGTVLGRPSRSFHGGLLSVFGLLAVFFAAVAYRPHLLRGEYDSSLKTENVTESLAIDRDVVLRIGGPPLFAGVRFASFASDWDERYALSRGNAHLRDIACASGVTHILVNDRIDGEWQAIQYMSAYGPREWVNFDDKRYFTPRGSGWWDDRSDATTYDRRPLQLLQLRNCRHVETPANTLGGPVEVVNDGVIVRQIRQDSYNNQNFAVSPRVVVEPRYSGDFRNAVLSWRFTLSRSDVFKPPVLEANVSHSGSSKVQDIVLRTGQSKLVVVHTTFPHRVTIETKPRAGEGTYFAIDNFEVRSLRGAP